MILRHPAILFVCIQIALLTSCGNESNLTEASTDDTNTQSSAESSEPSESEQTGSDPTQGLNQEQTNPDTPASTIAITPEYGRDQSIEKNALAATGDGKYWVDIWINEHDDSKKLNTAVEIEGIWQPVTTLTTGVVIDIAVAASEHQAMATWLAIENNTGFSGRYVLYTAHLLNGEWQPAIVADTPTIDNESRSISKIAIAALPGDRFALHWLARDRNGPSLQLYSEWNNTQWSTPKVVSTHAQTLYDNELFASTDGDLTNLYRKSFIDEDDQSQSAHWSQDRIADLWQPVTRIDQFEAPAWLRVLGRNDRSFASSNNGKQMVAWAVTLQDSFGTLFYGIASTQREAIGHPWSTPHFELTGNDTIESLDIAINNEGNAVIAWYRKTGLNTIELMLSRYTTYSSWQTASSNIMQPEYISVIPADPAKTYPDPNQFVLKTVDNRFLLTALIEVAYLETRSYYDSLIVGEIGIGLPLVPYSAEISRALGQQLLSCYSSNELYRCSRRTEKYNFRAATPNTLLTEQIKISEVPGP